MSGMCLVDKLVAPLSLLIQVVVIGVKKSLLLILKMMYRFETCNKQKASGICSGEISVLFEERSGNDQTEHSGRNHDHYEI